MPVRSSSRLVDVYQVLEADRSDSWQELRRRYRARARELHPDVQVHRAGTQRLDSARATALFSQLQAAWAQVATPELRASYDLSREARPERRRSNPVRPTRVPAWPSGPRAAVLLRAGPGDLHIAVPGGGWDLSLAGYAQLVDDGSAPPLLIGDLPPHREVREALRGLRFVERHRLNTMVGLVEPVEERGMAPDAPDDDGRWKLLQLGRAMGHWAAAQPTRRRDLPYASDLLLMGKLSLAGYELNLPHPAGLLTCTEPRPLTRLEAQERKTQSLLDIWLPPPTLVLAAHWSGDRDLQQSLALGLTGAQSLSGTAAGDPAISLRALGSRRPRADHHEPVWGSALDRPESLPESLMGLRSFKMAWAWLRERQRLPALLPWGDPPSLSGRDQSLSDAGARLTAHLLWNLLDRLTEQATLAALQGPALRLRVRPDMADEVAHVARSVVGEVTDSLLGLPLSPGIG
ncbi:MAG TPA: DnaJ domain-containing protein [Candidatus Dormibacteraeota bacterium]|nr:DnaJ domain-containing protein [Candidatus Dormibacteraeota bacterium]